MGIEKYIGYGQPNLDFKLTLSPLLNLLKHQTAFENLKNKFSVRLILQQQGY